MLSNVLLTSTKTRIESIQRSRFILIYSVISNIVVDGLLFVQVLVTECLRNNVHKKITEIISRELWHLISNFLHITSLLVDRQRNNSNQNVFLPYGSYFSAETLKFMRLNVVKFRDHSDLHLQGHR